MQHPFPSIALQLPFPCHPICHNGNSNACEWKRRWLEDKVGSFEIQPATNDITATNDIIGLKRYNSNETYANVYILVISLY